MGKLRRPPGLLRRGAGKPPVEMLTAHPKQNQVKLQLKDANA